MEELTFTDLAVLERIDETTVVERFGSRINSSFFDAANMLGTLKQKGFIDFRSQFPGPSEVFLTDTGKMVMALAKEKSAQELDRLDEIILSTIANGYKEPRRIEEKLNIKSSDLAYHLGRLAAQNYAGYTLRSGKVEFALTEEGFKRAGYPQPPSEEDLRRDSEDIEAIIGDRPVAPAASAAPAKPVKLDREARLRAKLEYYSKDILKYVIVAVMLLAAALGLAAYILLRR